MGNTGINKSGNEGAFACYIKILPEMMYLTMY